MTYDLMSAGYTIEGGQPVVCLFGRDESKKRIRIKVRGFKPFFYGVVPSSDLHDILGRPIKKVICQKPSDVPQRAKMFDYTCEAKIPFELRYLISQGIYCGFDISGNAIIPCDSIGVPPRILYLDFEMVSPPEVTPKPLEPIYPIVNAGFMDSYTGEKFLLFLAHENNWINLPAMRVDEKRDLAKFEAYVKARLRGEKSGIYYDLVYFKTEKLLWHGMVKVIEIIDPDVLAGWYSNSFDLPYWIRRAKRQAFPISRISPIGKVAAPYNHERKKWEIPVVRGRQCCDLLEFYKTLTKPEGSKYTYDLKWIVKEECGLVYEDLGDRIEVFFNGKGKTTKGLTGHRALLEYGRRELDALKAIDEKRGLIAEFDRRRRIFGSFLEGAHIALRNHIAYLHRVAPAPLPTFGFSKEKKLKGAIVGTVLKRGLERMVGVVDIHSLYPNVIVGKNLSFETKVKTAEGVSFKKSPEGFLRKAILRLMAEREKLRNARKGLPPDSPEYKQLWTQEQSFKYAVRSFWGVMKHLDLDIAQEITRTGRQLLSRLIEATSKAGYEVIYYDTDSQFFKLHTDDWKEGYEVEKMCNEFLVDLSAEMGLDKPLVLEYEKCYDLLFLHARKHYIGHVIMKDGKEVDFFEKKGIAARRSDSALVTIRVSDKFFDVLMRERSERKALRVIEQAVRSFRSNKLSEIAIPKGLSRDPSDYDKTNPWIRGVLNGREIFKFRFREDKKPLLIYCKSPAEEICFPDYETADLYADKVVVDWDMMIEKTLRNKLEPFVEALGYSWSGVFDKKKQAEISRWF